MRMRNLVNQAVCFQQPQLTGHRARLPALGQFVGFPFAIKQRPDVSVAKPIEQELLPRKRRRSQPFSCPMTRSRCRCIKLFMASFLSERWSATTHLSAGTTPFVESAGPTDAPRFSSLLRVLGVSVVNPFGCGHRPRWVNLCDLWALTLHPAATQRHRLREPLRLLI